MPETPEAQKQIEHFGWDAAEVRAVIAATIKGLRLGPGGRERSLAITKLQEARMWLNEVLKAE